MNLLKIILFVAPLMIALTGYSKNIGEKNVYSKETLLAHLGSEDVKNQVEVYPNPSIDFVIINIQNSELENVKFKLHSIIGNTVDFEVESVGRDKYKIDLKEYSEGYYFLIIEDEITAFKEGYKFLKKNN